MPGGGEPAAVTLVVPVTVEVLAEAASGLLLGDLAV